MGILTKKGRGELVMRPERWDIFGAEWSRRASEIVRFSLNLVPKPELDL